MDGYNQAQNFWIFGVCTSFGWLQNVDWFRYIHFTTSGMWKEKIVSHWKRSRESIIIEYSMVTDYILCCCSCFPFDSIRWREKQNRLSWKHDHFTRSVQVWELYSRVYRIFFVSFGGQLETIIVFVLMFYTLLNFPWPSKIYLSFQCDEIALFFDKSVIWTDARSKLFDKLATICHY